MKDSGVATKKSRLLIYNCCPGTVMAVDLALLGCRFGSTAVCTVRHWPFLLGSSTLLKLCLLWAALALRCYTENWFRRNHWPWCWERLPVKERRRNIPAPQVFEDKLNHLTRGTKLNRKWLSSFVSPLCLNCWLKTRWKSFRVFPTPSIKHSLKMQFLIFVGMSCSRAHTGLMFVFV